MMSNGANSGSHLATKDDINRLLQGQQASAETVQASILQITATLQTITATVGGLREDTEAGLHAIRQEQGIMKQTMEQHQKQIQELQDGLKQQQQQRQGAPSQPAWAGMAAGGTGRAGGNGGRGPRFIIPNTGRGSETSTSGSGAGATAATDKRDVRAVVIKLRNGGTSATAAVAAMTEAVNKGLTISQETGPFGFSYIRGLGKVGQEMMARAEAAPAAGSGGAAASTATATSSSVGADAQAEPQQTTYQVVAWFNTAWADGSGWEELISVVAQRKREGLVWDWGVKDYLTVAGKQARLALQPHYMQALTEGKEPVWRNGAEIWVRSNGPNSPYELYRTPEQAATDTPMGDATSNQQ